MTYIGGPSPDFLRLSDLSSILNDPATLHAAMLLATSHFRMVQGPESHAIDLLQLKSMAVNEIIKALTEEGRGISDHLIAAVAKLASYEALYGERTICNTHMQGLTRMVSLRGGLPALGLGGFLEHFCLWVDSNTSNITGHDLYFDNCEFPPSSPTIKHPQPDPAHFFADDLS